MSNRIARFSLLAAVMFAFAPRSDAQETYSLSATAQNVTDLNKIISGKNNDTCRAFQQSLGCTQGQACTAAGAAGGASCTAAQARAANARIYPLTQPGREEYVTFAIAVPAFVVQLAAAPGSNVAAYCTYFASLNQAGKDTELSHMGLPTGATTCPLQ